MSKPNDGGPAFPVAENHSVADSCPWTCGMSLRDYFAAQAMASMNISEVMEAFRRNDYAGRQDHRTYMPVRDFAELAKAAYQQADAMLDARGGGA